MPQDTPNTIDDVVLRVERLETNALHYESSPNLFGALDHSIRSMLQAHGYSLTGSLPDKTSFKMEADRRHLSPERRSETLQLRFDLGERAYRLASKFLLSFHEFKNGEVENHPLPPTKIKGLFDALHSLDDTSSIEAMNYFSAAVSAASANNGAGVYAIQYFFNEMLPKIRNSSATRLQELDALKSTNKGVYEKHRTLVLASYKAALLSSMEAVTGAVGLGKEAPKQLAEYVGRNRYGAQDRENLNGKLLKEMVEGGDFRRSLALLEEELGGVIVGLNYHSNRDKSYAKVGMIISPDGVKTLAPINVQVEKGDKPVRGFFLQAGQLVAGINAFPYSAHNSTTTKAMLNIENHL